MRALGSNSIASVLRVMVSVVHFLALVGLPIVALFHLAGIAAFMVEGADKMPVLSSLREAPATLWSYITGLCVVVVAFGGVILLTHFLRAILRTLVDGDPFVAENAPRLMRIAIVIAAMEIARWLIHVMAMWMGPFEDGRFVVNLAAWTAVLVLLVLSQVFAEGTRLREEEKMTI